MCGLLAKNKGIIVWILKRCRRHHVDYTEQNTLIFSRKKQQVIKINCRLLAAEVRGQFEFH